ncbi:hypothetical protein QZM18_13965 [Burkholderia diffusa]|uniref:hypothetical protein n=1 Tax=Burkholderia diffusa TaxID=488732 RepID=UPI002652F0AF|nr:hypothetical protein [Burkholderia diffusa]MDN7905218.1 hypothetical protein [Burkholderia diffusa]
MTQLVSTSCGMMEYKQDSSFEARAVTFLALYKNSRTAKSIVHIALDSTRQDAYDIGTAGDYVAVSLNAQDGLSWYENHSFEPASAADSMNSAPNPVQSLWNKRRLHVSSETEMTKISATLAAMRILCRRGDVDAAVDRTFDVIETAFANRDLDTVDELLKGAEPADLDSRVTVGMLRATSRAKDMLHAWNVLFLKERQRLVAEGRNDKKVLRGMLPLHADTAITSESTI